MRFWPLLAVAAAATAQSCNQTIAETKKLTTKDGATYAYDYVPAKDGKATVLLIHGYPETRQHWRAQVADLAAEGYGVVAPDCLGYGDSDRPLEVEAYNLKRLSGHLAEILDNEQIPTVVGVGHDWGASLLSRAAVWQRERFEKLTFMSIGYGPAGIFLDIDLFNAMSLEAAGYAQLGYWYFLNSYDFGTIGSANVESLFNLVFPVNISSWGMDLATLGAARLWLTTGKTTETPDYVPRGYKEKWIAANSREGAVEAPTNYYKALMRGYQAADEAGLTDEDRLLNVPVLAIGGALDPLTPAVQMRNQTEPFCTQGYEEVVLESGHWLAYEDSEGVSAALLNFLKA
jgi:soluble epoxide hydrolase/lipid-phosphate phosphatase